MVGDGTEPSRGPHRFAQLGKPERDMVYGDIKKPGANGFDPECSKSYISNYIRPKCYLTSGTKELKTDNKGKIKKSQNGVA